MQAIKADMMSILNKRPLNRVERRKLQTYHSLLQATAEILTERGYHKFSIKAVTERADVGYGTFYTHFDNRDEAIWTVLLRQFGEQQKLIEAQVEALDSPQRELKSWELFFTSIAQNIEGFNALFGENGSVALRYQLENYTTEVYQRNIIAKHYHIPPAYDGLPIDYLAHFMAGAQLQLVRWWLASDMRYTASDMAKMLYRTIYHESV